MTTTDLARLRLVKAQIAAQEHECVECVEPIAKGERYMRAALPPTVEAFPDPEVFQEQAWQFVDRTWVIEKTHELCYTKRYFRPAIRPEVPCPNHHCILVGQHDNHRNIYGSQWVNRT